MKIDEDFEITLTDRDGFNVLLVQVRWRDVVLCEINKERGADRMEMVVHCNDIIYNDRNILFSLDMFLHAMNIAREKLMLL